MSSFDFKSLRIPQNNSKMKSIVNLSYNKKDTIVPNLIVPVMVEKTQPGDVWSLKITGFLRWLYLKVPCLDTLQVSLNVFYAEHIDLFQDAQAVIKGSGDSEYDQGDYNFPYVVNMLAPYYFVKLEDSTLKGAYLPVHPAAYLTDQADAHTPELNGNAKLTLKNLLTYTIVMSYSFLGDDKIIELPYDTCYTELMSQGYWSALSNEEKENTLINRLEIPGRAHIGGLFEKIYGVVGDSPKAVNAEPVIMYYLIFDYYYRAQQHIKPFVARVKGVDHTIDENMLAYLSETTITSFSKYTNFMVLKYGNNQFHFEDGCVCDTWSEKQLCLSRFINGNRILLASSVIGQNVLSGITSSIFYKLITFYNGGLCPVLKKPDYFTMATIKPSAVDPVQIPQPDIDPNESELVNIPTFIDFRKSVLMNSYFEKINANGYLFQDYMLAFFGQVIDDKNLRIPRLVGRASTTFDIIPVVQQSGKNSTDGTPLGTLAANAVANFSTKLMRFTSEMGGFVMAVLTITGSNSYQEGYARWCFERSSLEQYNPHFLGVGDQAIMNFELFNPALCYYTRYFFRNPNNTPPASEIPNLGFTASEDRYVNDGKDLPVTTGVIQAVMDFTDPRFLAALKQPFKGFGFIPRYQELRAGLNKIGGNFKSRSDLIHTLNPSYSSGFAGGQLINRGRNNIGFSAKQGFLASVASLDVWTLSEDYDFEILLGDKSNSPDDYGFLSNTPPLNSSFLISNKPWQRLVEYNDIPPIYLSLNVIAHVARTITAQSIQGQGVHL